MDGNPTIRLLTITKNNRISDMDQSIPVFAKATAVIVALLGFSLNDSKAEENCIK